MPLITLSTSIKINQKNIFMEDCSKLLSTLTNKSEKYVMVRLFEQIPIYFSQSFDPACFIDVKSIGSIEPSKMSESISEFISNKLKIPTHRTYIKFENIEASNWAYGGKPFG